MDIKKEIFKNLIKGKSIFLVGATDSGKSWFAERELLPYLQKMGLSAVYVPSCDKLPKSGISGDCAIVDEAETLRDRDFLQSRHPDQTPYYSKEYLLKIDGWFKKLKRIQIPCVYVITRNHSAEIQNLLETIKKTDWDSREVEVIAFERRQ